MADLVARTFVQPSASTLEISSLDLTKIADAGHGCVHFLCGRSGKFLAAEKKPVCQSTNFEIEVGLLLNENVLSRLERCSRNPEWDSPEPFQMR